MTKNIINFGQAEKNARKRDLEIADDQFKQDHNEISKVELEKAIETMAKATGKELYIGTKRSPQSKVRFVQILQENLNYLYEHDYLTSREKIFLFDIMQYVAFDSNGIVLDIKAKNLTPVNISEIAKLIKTERSHTSRIITSLVKKGLLFKGESGLEGNNARASVIFVNPHIIYAGDKDNVNEALKLMFNRAMKMPILNNLPNKLF